MKSCLLYVAIISSAKLSSTICLRRLPPRLSPLGEERTGEGHLTLIITLRADFYAYLAQYPELRDAVAQQQEYIGPMTIEELRLAIEEPARRGHWDFEPGLVDLILRDVGDEPGALPLLSHALLETWKRRAGHTLTLKGYADAGGVRGAIAHTAESVFQKLSSEERIIARNVFVRLTELGEGTEDTRRRVTFEEIMSHAEDTDEIREVLNTLAEARLITLGEDTVEVAHEALIREWPQLREWLSQDREGLQLHRRMTEASREWELLERDNGVLYRGAQLAQVREWAGLHPNALNAGENAFLEAPNAFEQNKIAEREAQQKRELEAAQKLAETERRSATQLRIRSRHYDSWVNCDHFGIAGRHVWRAIEPKCRASRNQFQTSGSTAPCIGGESLVDGGRQFRADRLAQLAIHENSIYARRRCRLADAARFDYPVKTYNQAGPVWTATFSPDGKYIPR